MGLMANSTTSCQSVCPGHTLFQKSYLCTPGRMAELT